MAGIFLQTPLSWVGIRQIPVFARQTLNGTGIYNLITHHSRNTQLIHNELNKNFPKVNYTSKPNRDW